MNITLDMRKEKAHIKQAIRSYNEIRRLYLNLTDAVRESKQVQTFEEECRVRAAWDAYSLAKTTIELYRRMGLVRLDDNDRYYIGA